MNVYICMCSSQTLVLSLQAAPKCQEVWEQLLDMSMLWASYWCLNVKCFLWAHMFEDLAFPDGTVLGGCWTFVMDDLINGSGFWRSSLLGVISSSVPPELSISWFSKEKSLCKCHPLPTTQQTEQLQPPYQLCYDGLDPLKLWARVNLSLPFLKLSHFITVSRKTATMPPASSSQEWDLFQI